MAVNPVAIRGNLPVATPQVYPMATPGAVAPYSLSDEPVEVPFERISAFAIQESGQFGPLNEEQLRNFLRHKLDKRAFCSRDVIKMYTDDFQGLYVQLENLKSRIMQINENEKSGGNKMKNRINQLEKAPRNQRPMSRYLANTLINIAVNKAAFKTAGSEGPLGEDELISFVRTGNYDYNGPINELITQLGKLRLYIHDNLDLDKKGTKLLYDRIVKALSDITEEMETYSSDDSYSFPEMRSELY